MEGFETSPALPLFHGMTMESQYDKGISEPQGNHLISGNALHDLCGLLI